MKKNILGGLFLLLFYLPVCAQLNEFMISSYFCYNIPSGTTEESFFRRLKNDYSFNTVLMTSPDIKLNSTQLSYYKKAKDAGLKAIAYTNNLYSRNSVFDKTAALADMHTLAGANYNVIGYHIVDEPEVFVGYPNVSLPKPIGAYIYNIPQYTEFVRAYSPSLLRFANLLPRAVYGGEKYREDYIQRYIDESNPNLLSFDHYPIADGNDRFFVGLYDVAIKSVENSIPFMYVLTPFKSKNDIMLNQVPTRTIYGKNLAEFRYVIFGALAYGAKGLNYWSGFDWVCSHYSKFFPLSFENGVLQELSGLHRKLIDNSSTLLSLNFASAYHVSAKRTFEFGETIKDRKEDQIYEFNKWDNIVNDRFAIELFSNPTIPASEYRVLPSGDILNIPQPEELVITFLTNHWGEIYFWLYNKSLSRELNLSLGIKSTVRVKDVFNNIAYSRYDKLKLSPGEAKLFTAVSGAYRGWNYTVAKTYNSDFYPLETSYMLNIGSKSSNPNVTFRSGATKTFVADEIKINSLKAEKGSVVRFKAYKKSNTRLNGMLLSSEEALSDETVEVNESLYEDSNVYVYPNPTSDDFIYLYVESLEEEIEVRMYDMVGKIIQTVKTSNPETLISLENMHPGIYFLNFNKGEQIHNIKIVKR